MKRLLLAAVMVLVGLVGMVGFSSAAAAKPKMYYLTNDYFYGGDATTACDSGFHMASLSEIQDPSNLQYAPGRNPAYLVSYEPPPPLQTSDQFPDHTGWVRTGFFAQMWVPDYCDFSMSSFEQQSGTTMTRRSLRGENNGHSLYEEADPTAWWQSTRIVSYSQPEPVWCVEDPE